MPADMTVHQSHDICLGLQDAVEALDEVERAFVHVDYASRHYPEHKTERQLMQSSDGISGATTMAIPVARAPSMIGDDASSENDGSGGSGGSRGMTKDENLRDAGMDDPLLLPV